jgi:hypothetical protein
MGVSEELYIYPLINISGGQMAKAEVLHYPTLRTVMAIEDVVKNAETAISRNRILESLPTSVMRSTLNVALDYLEKRGMILETKNGFVWTFNPDAKLAEAERQGRKM